MSTDSISLDECRSLIELLQKNQGCLARALETTTRDLSECYRIIEIMHRELLKNLSSSQIDSLTMGANDAA